MSKSKYSNLAPLRPVKILMPFHHKNITIHIPGPHRISHHHFASELANYSPILTEHGLSIHGKISDGTIRDWAIPLSILIIYYFHPVSHEMLQISPKYLYERLQMVEPNMTQYIFKPGVWSITDGEGVIELPPSYLIHLKKKPKE